MATDRRNAGKIIPKDLVRVKRKSQVSHTAKLQFISKYKRVSDPTNKRSVTTQYRALKQFPLYLLKPANKTQLKELKKRGFFTTTKGVIIDGPRDSKRQPIKGARLRISKSGDAIFTSVKSRRDYIIGFTKAEKKAFAADPNRFIARKLEELKARYPNIRNTKNIQVRLQWGAYQSTKDYYPAYFSRAYPEKKEKRNAQDRLTGLHIVVHMKPKKKAPTRTTKKAPTRTTKKAPTRTTKKAPSHAKKKK